MALGLLLGFVLIFIVLVLFIYGYTTRVANRAITEQFRNAESLVAGRTPPRWRSQIDRRLALARVFGRLGGEVSGEALALQKLEGLRRFFEKSHFFESEEAREELLLQFQEIKARWERMDWREISASPEG